jgi:enoyl-CoA hydratase/carnithine racemase
MAQAMTESNSDTKTKIVVITGAGDKSFTSGYDLKCLIEDSRKMVPPAENGAT